MTKIKYTGATLTVSLIEFIKAVPRFKELEMRTYLMIISTFTKRSLIYRQGAICSILIHDEESELLEQPLTLNVY